jgi:hypothetical protein
MSNVLQKKAVRYVCVSCNIFKSWQITDISRMIAESLNIPKIVVLRILKEELGKKKLCVCFFSTLLEIWAKESSGHNLLRHYLDGRCRQKLFLTKLLREMRPSVLSTSMTPKQSDSVLNGLVRHPLGRRNWNSNGLASRPCWKFFRHSRRSA